MIDLKGLSAKQLDALVKNAQNRKDLLQKRQPASKVRSEVLKYVGAHGYSMEELFGVDIPAKRPRAARASTKEGTSTGKVKPKYRNPDNPRETWSGRGRAPRWLAALMEKGHKPEQYLIHS